MTSDPQVFTVELDRALVQVKGQVDRFVRGLTLEFLNRVSRRTPVQTGLLRSSWATGLNGEMAQPGSAAILRAVLGDTVLIENPVAYAGFVEFGTRFMRPRAMVRTTVAEVPAIAAQVAAALR